MKRIKYKTIIDRMRESLCPVCGHPVEDGYVLLLKKIKKHFHGSIEVMSKTTSHTATCPACETNWSELYVLQGIEIIETTVNQDVEIENDLSSIENISEILEAVLNMRKVLPALIGIDKRFDDLIAEKLKGDKDG